MRYLLILPVALLLAACAADGGFVSPSEMTAEERCSNAALALALVEANMPEGSATVERARVNYALLCPQAAVEPLLAE